MVVTGSRYSLHQRYLVKIGSRVTHLYFSCNFYDVSLYFQFYITVLSPWPLSLISLSVLFSIFPLSLSILVLSLPLSFLALSPSFLSFPAVFTPRLHLSPTSSSHLLSLPAHALLLFSPLLRLLAFPSSSSHPLLSHLVCLTPPPSSLFPSFSSYSIMVRFDCLFGYVSNLLNEIWCVSCKDPRSSLVIREVCSCFRN
ncbi:Uncharacterised protein at_DN0553 [Pycnogonum litorale]